MLVFSATEHLCVVFANVASEETFLLLSV